MLDWVVIGGATLTAAWMACTTDLPWSDRIWMGATLLIVYYAAVSLTFRLMEIDYDAFRVF